MLSPDLSRLGEWKDLSFFSSEFEGISKAISEDGRVILPPASQRFAALELTAPETTRVVILGQDPYPTAGHAMGLAFSVTPQTKLPASLRNIYKELAEDIGDTPATGDLTHWAKQGVLLLNTCLTVPEGEANGHASLGWQCLTAEVLERLDDAPRAFLLWGKPAQKLAEGLRNPQHLLIKTAHPSPLSARRGFFGSRPFSQVNAWLRQNGQQPIDWIGPKTTDPQLSLL